MIWVLVMAGVLMAGMTALAARLGVSYERSFCDELAARLGRWAAVLVGGSVFLICACFQFSNNMGVLAAVEPYMETSKESTAQPIWPAVVLTLLNGIIIATMYGLRKLYKPLERLMMLLMLAMIIGFVGNLAFAKPSPAGVLSGLVPSLPQAESDSFS